jgi:hypothetical protein
MSRGSYCVLFVHHTCPYYCVLNFTNYFCHAQDVSNICVPNFILCYSFILHEHAYIQDIFAG